LHEALEAYDILAQSDVYISVIDLYSIKPLDAATVISVAKSSKNKIITVEDHYLEGGIGEAVLSAVRNEGIMVQSLAVKELPRSGKPEELLAWSGIDAGAIVKAVRAWL
jgi:transketolase